MLTVMLFTCFVVMSGTTALEKYRYALAYSCGLRVIFVTKKLEEDDKINKLVIKESRSQKNP